MPSRPGSPPPGGGRRVSFAFDATLRVWTARTDRWVFADLPEAVSDEIADLVEGRTRGWGSTRVDVALGDSRWRTSIFPDASTYTLPVKRSVRIAEGVDEGDRVRIVVTLVDVS